MKGQGLRSWGFNGFLRSMGIDGAKALPWLLGSCLVMVFLVGCSWMNRDDADGTSSPGEVKNRQLSEAEYLKGLAAGKVSYPKDVKPILDQRCVVCHGCYDAPCQLKLESPEALDRGASKALVYDGARMQSMAPTRMGVDAKSTGSWRKRGFYPVLNEGGDSEADEINHAVLARMLLLKKANPLPSSGLLSKDFDLGVNRSQECPTDASFDAFAKKHPAWGMPYGLPGLSPQEHRVLIRWVKEGARYPSPTEPSRVTLKSILRVETFLNGDSAKERLVGRYIYEHLFMGHLYFKGETHRTFYRLVRSTTPSGVPIDEIPSIRPYDDPGSRFYYRLKPLHQTIVDKNHDIYEIGDDRLRRWRTLFLNEAYEVKAVPGYDPGLAANPFLVFQDLPPQARYQFMLDDAYYFISGFMKGPVCRGQVALNVIRDQFWVMFYDPKKDLISGDAQFLKSGANLLRLPNEKEADVGVEDIVITYTESQKAYLKAKDDYLKALPDNTRNTVDALWTGEGRNPNAALTAFRHFDSASLSYGFVGDRPQTVWLVDYPLFERIHYLLVAGFNVFGPVTHQAATRLFMDHLRLEAENNFLSLFPASQRPKIYRQWNRGLLSEIKSAVVNPYYGYGKDTGVHFTSTHYAQELFGQVEQKLGTAIGPSVTLHRCPPKASCDRIEARPDQVEMERTLKPLTSLVGGGIQYLPELSLIRIHDQAQSSLEGRVYSLVNNKALENVSLMLLESLRRLPEEDTLTVVPGIVGSYPNFFFDVPKDRLKDFVSRILTLKTSEDFSRIVESYGVRRTRPDFWSFSDFFNRSHLEEAPVSSGLLDLSRYENL